MRVALDLSIQETAEPTGVERAQAALLDALLDADAEGSHDHELLLLSPGRVPDRWRAHPRVRCAEGRGGPAWLWRETAVPRAVREARADLFHAPVAALPMRLRCPMIATVHEVPWAGEGAGPGDTRAGHRLRLHLAANMAWRIACPSARTAAHVARLHPDAEPRLRVLPHAVAALPAPAEPVAREPGLLLSVGRLRAKKNLELLLEALARLPAVAGRAPRLVLAGPDGDAAEALRARASRADLAGRVEFAGFVPDAQLAALYARAACVVQPSLFEGFGLPALEAMAAGAPLVACTGGVVDEVAAGAALVVDPRDPAALAGALAELLGDPARAARLAEAGRARAASFGARRLREALLALWAEHAP